MCISKLVASADFITAGTVFLQSTANCTINTPCICANIQILEFAQNVFAKVLTLRKVYGIIDIETNEEPKGTQ